MEDPEGWHNRFRWETTNRIDGEVFKPLFAAGQGAPNAPVRVLVAMMILKEGQGISDEQLYEQARFNALTRSALGMRDADEAPPVESTYYLFRKRIVEYQRENGKDRMGEVFRQITKEQCLGFGVGGKAVRMDRTLIGRDIAWYSRYGVVHETIRVVFGKYGSGR